jgi:hypothetical protein
MNVVRNPWQRPHQSARRLAGGQRRRLAALKRLVVVSASGVLLIIQCQRPMRQLAAHRYPWGRHSSTPTSGAGAAPLMRHHGFSTKGAISLASHSEFISNSHTVGSRLAVIDELCTDALRVSIHNNSPVSQIFSIELN